MNAGMQAPAAGPLLEARRLAVKIGSALLVDAESGALRRGWLDGVARDIAEAKARGADVIVISSGSIALGRRALGLPAGRCRWSRRRPPPPSARSASRRPIRRRSPPTG